jgi:hypothetical protein
MEGVLRRLRPSRRSGLEKDPRCLAGATARVKEHHAADVQTFAPRALVGPGSRSGKIDGAQRILGPTRFGQRMSADQKLRCPQRIRWIDLGELRERIR